MFTGPEGVAKICVLLCRFLDIDGKWLRAIILKSDRILLRLRPPGIASTKELADVIGL